jgi:beta-glucanase (GH16 family)
MVKDIPHLKNVRPSLTHSLIFTVLLALFTQVSAFSQTTVLYSENFNTNKTLGWSGSDLGAGAFSSTIVTSLSNNGFPTAPTSGYLALTANSSSKATNAGWYVAQVLANITTPNGLGQTDLSKISFTAKVRAKGLPSSGAVAILRIMASGDVPGSYTAYKRITFEPILQNGSDWVTIGGTFDDTSLQSAKGSRYNFSSTATSYEITVEISGNNQSTASGYVAYNSPTGPSNLGRKNPGFAPNSSIRVEFDDVLLAVSNAAAQTTAIGTVSPKSGVTGSSVTITGVAFGSSPTVSFNGTPATSVSVNGDGTSISAVVPAGATTGKITVVGSNATASSAYNFFVTTPSNLLADPNFDGSQAMEFWTYFEGARIITTSNLAPDATTSWNNIPGAQANTPYMFFPGWEGTPYGGFMQENIPFNPVNGDFFTATFQAKFEGNFYADSTIIAFMDGLTEIATKDITGEIKANQKTDGESGSWRTYQATFKATPAILSAGRLTLKFQPITRTLTTMGSVFVDQVSLTQANSADIGPQIAVKINEIPQPSNNVSKTLISPIVGQSNVYQLKVENTGGQDLTVTSVNVSGTSFSVDNGASARTILPGASSVYLIRTAPTVSGPLTGTLTIVNNDKESSDRSFTIPITTIAANLSDNFDSTNSPVNLGWVAFASSNNLLNNSSVTNTNGTLRLKINSSSTNTDWNWTYGVQKTFVSPGTLNLNNSQLALRLCATGAFAAIAGRPDLSTNKFEVLLESLNQYQEVSGSIRFGSWVDEKKPAATAGTTNYFSPDGTNDRVVLVLPDTTNSYTTFTFTNLSQSSNIVQSKFVANAPYLRLTLRANDANFGRDTNNTILVDSLGLSISQLGFAMANGGFELDASNIPVPTPPISWQQYPLDGVNKDIVTNGVAVFNQFDTNSYSTVFKAHAGTKAMKIWPQNFKPDGVWAGPVQTGVVYQEFLASASLTPGTKIYARGMAKIFAVDPLSGGSTFSYGFKYMDNQNNEVGRDVITLTAANSSSYRDRWQAITANGTIPADADKIQVICEFVQNAETDKGSVYLDDLSIGFGTIAPTTTVGSSTYSLVWSDEFDGTSLNSGNWVAETGRGPNSDGWGNNELQTYTTNNANLRVENGSLIMQAVKTNSSWTSARIKSQDLRSFKYGKIEFRAKLPAGVGPWPAAWLLGNNISSVNWPACGEIDVMEWRGGYNGVANSDANTVGHALHSASRNGSNPVEPTSRSAVTNPSSAFHTYAVLWNSSNLVFSVDGVDKATLTPPSADADAFRQEFFLLLNLAVGGAYVGSIDSSLTSATYEVDYVRVYQDSAGFLSSDTTPPVLTLRGINPVSVSWGSIYTDEGATAFDAGDNASVSVTTVNGVNTTIPGNYLVTYTATDSKANTATTNRAVSVIMANGGTNIGSDGLSDILRYAFGGNGTSSIPTNLLPTVNISGPNLVLTYYSRTNSNVNLTPMVSTDLANSNNWTNSGITVNTLTTLSTNGTTLEKRQASTPVSGAKKFLRLKATHTP